MNNFAARENSPTLALPFDACQLGYGASAKGRRCYCLEDRNFNFNRIDAQPRVTRKHIRDSIPERKRREK